MYRPHPKTASPDNCRGGLRPPRYLPRYTLFVADALFATIFRRMIKRPPQLALPSRQILCFPASSSSTSPAAAASYPSPGRLRPVQLQFRLPAALFISPAHQHIINNEQHRVTTRATAPWESAGIWPGSQAHLSQVFALAYPVSLQPHHHPRWHPLGQEVYLAILFHYFSDPMGNCHILVHPE